jgi:hypothetical protein
VATKKQPVTGKTLGEMTAAELTDELGRLEQRLEPHRIDIEREDKLRSEIRQRYDDQPANQSFEVAGNEYSAAIGERGNVTIIDNQRVLKAFGARRFAEIAKVTLGALQRTSNNVDALIRKEQIGPRSLRIFRKAA